MLQNKIMSAIKAVVVGEPMITAFLFLRVDADKVANTLKISQKLSVSVITPGYSYVNLDGSEQSHS